MKNPGLVVFISHFLLMGIRIIRKMYPIILIFLMSCGSNDDGLNQHQMVNKIKSQSWCTSDILPLGTIVRLKFDESSKPNQGKAKIIFDHLVKNNQNNPPYSSYKFSDRSYEWALGRSENNSSQEHMMYLTLSFSEGSRVPNQIELSNTLLFIEKPTFLFGKEKVIFGTCPEESSFAIGSDPIDYSLRYSQAKNLHELEQGYVPVEILWPTKPTKATEVYDQLWCQSIYSLNENPLNEENPIHLEINRLNTIQFVDDGNIVHSHLTWYSWQAEEGVELGVKTSYIRQQYVIDENSGQMVIHQPKGYELGDLDRLVAFDVEFRTDGERFIMLTPGYSEQSSNYPPTLRKSLTNVYYNCSIIKDNPIFKDLFTSITSQTRETLSEPPNFNELTGFIPYINDFF